MFWWNFGVNNQMVEDVLVHRHALPWTQFQTQNPNLAVLEYRGEVSEIDPQRVESRIHHRAGEQTTERCLGTKLDLVHAPNDGIKLRVAV